MQRDPCLIKSVAHAGQLMAAFESPGEILSQRELVKRTKLSRGIVFRLLYTLERHGLVEKIGNDQFRLMYRRARTAQVENCLWHSRHRRHFHEVAESLRLAVERCEEIELLMLDHRYKAAVTAPSCRSTTRSSHSQRHVARLCCWYWSGALTWPKT